MEPFTTLTASAIPLMRDNVDTDAIIPSREMRTVTNRGLAEGLFAGWRYRTSGGRDPDPSFVLNQPGRDGAQILITGANFGCGSSREHAVWALAEFGIRAIVAPSFNPIFYNNCIANGVLPVVLARHCVEQIGALVENEPAARLTIDLNIKKINFGASVWDFEIEAEGRTALLAGLDPIDQTLHLKEDILAFRANDRDLRPWIYSSIAR